MSPHANPLHLSLIGLLLVLSQLLTAQFLPIIETLTIEDGLHIRDITGVAQDSAGFIWLGTDQGINRYDGYQFKLYNSDKENPYFIEKEKVNAANFLYRKQHEIWYIANEQLFRLDIASDQITGFDAKHGIRGEVLELHQDQAGQIWIVTDDHWAKPEEKAHQYLQKLIEPDSFAVIAKTERGIRKFTSVTTDRNGHVWWGTITGGMLSYSPEGVLLQQIRPDSFDWFGQKMYFTESFFDSQNRHYYFPKGKKGVWRFNDSLQVFEQVLAIQHVFYHALEDQLGNLWFASTQGLYRLESDGKVTDFSSVLKQQIDFKEIKHLYQDKTGLLWVATDNGLFKIRILPKLFDNFFNTQHSGWGNALRAILETPDGAILAWCSNNNQLYRLDAAGQFSIVPLPETPNPEDPTFIGARFFVIDQTGENLYTVNKNLVKIHLANAHTSIDTNFAPNLNIMTPNPLILLKDGRLLFGYSLSKLCLYNPLDGSHQLVFPENSLEKDYPTLRFFLESQSPGIVWIGTQDNGLLKINLNGTIEKHYTSQTYPALSKNNILVIYEDEDLSLWAGTYGGGLNHIFPEQDSIVIYQKKNGLSDNNLVGILPFEKDYLWISTYNGLTCFNKRTETFQNYFEEDGLTHNEFNYTSFFRDSRGLFYFGGMNGLNRFDPKTILRKEKLPALKFTALSHLNSKTNKTAFEDWSHLPPDKLEVTPSDQYFRVSWTMPSYFQSKKNQYYTRLVGFEEDWTYQGNNNYIRYNQLPPGDYTLLVRGTDYRGNESSQQLALPITVHPIFYKTWWFIITCLLLLAGIIYSFFQYRLQQLLAMERLRTKISSDLHDDVGSLLSGLAMQSEILEMSAREEDKARLQHIAYISRFAVTQMRDLVWSIDARRDKISDLLERMQELAEELLLPAEISYQIEKDEHININKKLPVNIRQNLFMIYKEAINNILRHSKADKVYIHLYNERNHFHLTVQDNGCATEKAYKTTGLGLANMSMRAKRMKGNIQFEREHGFCIHLSLPQPL